MGKALEVISGFAVAPSSTFTPWTVNTGNSLTIRNSAEGSQISLLELWGKNQTNGKIRIHSPRMHDNVQGIRMQVFAALILPLLPDSIKQKLFEQDTLTVEQTGSASAGDLEMGAFLVMYDDLPGVSSRLISKDELLSRMVNIVGVENTLALGTSGDYSGEEALNAEFDLLKGNTDYAILGYTLSADCLLVGWRGTDTGNLRVAGPGEAGQANLTSKWFVHLTEKYNTPLIPVFNSANVDSLLIDGVQDENGADTTVTTILAQLS